MITLEQINGIVLEENGKEIAEDSYLIDSDMDSFAYAIFWLKVSEIDEDNDTKITKEYVSGINYITYTVKELMDYLNGTA